MASMPKRVAVIGAGISGVVAAAHLKKEGIEVKLFERSNAAGGVWLFDNRSPLEPLYPSVLAPEVEANRPYDPALNVSEEEFQRLLHAPPGPCYVGLMNNVPTRLLETTLNPFPPGTLDNVSHSVLKEYIQDTALKTGVHSITEYDTEVKRLSKNGSKWLLEAVTLKQHTDGSLSRSTSKANFDTVVVASGHYHTPHIPDIPGLALLKQRHPTRIHHSKSYRRPSPFKDQNVLLIGAGVSATDIARELEPFAHKIYQSHRNGLFDLPSNLLPPNGTRIPQVTSFSTPESATDASTPDFAPEVPLPTTATLISGQTLCDIHAIILCTGYHTTLPFLPTHYAPAHTPPQNARPTTLITDGTQLHNLHKDIFYIPDPSLLFIGVPYFTATFTLFEFQAMVAAKVVAGKVALPSEEEMWGEYGERVRRKGYGKAFHSLREREEEYVEELVGWANGGLEGEERLEGHTEVWKEVKGQQVERVRALFAGGGSGVEGLVELVC